MEIKDLDASKFKYIGEQFLLLEEKYGHIGVDMWDGNIYHSCDTPMCHAGWCSVFLEEPHTGPNSSKLYYTDYAEVLSIFLGFRDEEDYQEFMCENPDIWGNEYGWDMFGECEAFVKKDKELTLKLIGEHYLQVSENIIKAQQEENKNDSL